MMKLTRLLIATNNPGKLREIKALLSNLNLEMMGLKDVFNNNPPEIKETGQTYLENALLKAETIAKLTQLPTLADDSGLEVATLDNFPGIKSARCYPGSDNDRNLALLKKMEGIDNRNARYVTLAVLYYPNRQQFIHTRGELKGQIAFKPTEKIIGGFGYDSIFIPEGYNKPLAELGDDVKLSISHRTKAISNLKLKIESE